MLIKNLYTVNDVIREIGISRRTVYNHIKSGLLTSIGKGLNRRITKESILNLYMIQYDCGFKKKISHSKVVDIH